MKKIYNHGYAGAKVLPMPSKAGLRSAIVPPGQSLWLFRVFFLCIVLLFSGHLQAQDETVDQPISGDTTVSAAGNIIATSTVVGPNSEAIFQAGKSIFLQNGFRAGNLSAGTEKRYLLAQSAIAFTASQAISDAYIDLHWEILPDYMTLPPDGNGMLYVQLLDQDTQKEVFFQEVHVHTIEENGKLEGSYRHYVGQRQQVNYKLQVRLEGDGAPIIDALTNSGLTDAYRIPTVTVSQAAFPDRVEINIENHSDLVGEYRVYREGQLLTSLAPSQTAYTDAYSFTSDNSLVNGQTYTYRIEPYSNLFETFLYHYRTLR